MEDSSDTDEESDDEVGEVEKDKEQEDIGNDQGCRSSEERDDGKEEAEEQSVVSSDPSAATSLKKSHRIKFKEDEVVKKVVLSDKRGERVRDKEKSVPKEEEKGEKDKGKTLMELLELEMRARAIKALLMKAGKEEGEAETLAIEEALDEAKKKEKEVKNAAKEGNRVDDASKESVEGAEKPPAEEEDEDDEEEVPEKVYNSNNSIMSKARDALMLSESKKLMEDQVAAKKAEEAELLLAEHTRKEALEKE